jgi:hypothetical protein
MNSPRTHPSSYRAVQLTTSHVYRYVDILVSSLDGTFNISERSGCYLVWCAKTGVLCKCAYSIHEAYDFCIGYAPSQESWLKESCFAETPHLPKGGILKVDWHHRESTRLSSGEYKPIPDIGLDFPQKEYPHLSTERDDMIAYTPSEEYGLADRQVRTKIGKYIRKCFPDLSDRDVAKYVDRFRVRTGSSTFTLHFTTDADQITDIFETQMYARGSTYVSCMYDKFTSWRGFRPYHVYSDSPDVAVAYITSGKEIIARSVVNMKDKQWVRAYSILPASEGKPLCDALTELLEAQGFTEGDMDGCLLSRDPNGENTLPYLDPGDMNADIVYRHNKYWWRVSSDGDYESTTTGTAEDTRPRCDVCNEIEDECACAECECYINECECEEQEEETTNETT